MASSPAKILFYVQQGVDTLDLAGPIEVFSHCRRVRDDISTSFYVPTLTSEHTSIVSEGGLPVFNLVPVKDIYLILDTFDMLVILGGSSGLILEGNTEPIHLIKAFSELSPKTDGKERILFSVCTGSLFLGAAGTLNGLTATTHPYYMDTFKRVTSEKGTTKIVGDRFVVNKSGAGGKEGLKVVTAGGVSSGIDAAIWIVGYLLGEEMRAVVETVIQWGNKGQAGLII
ncbi:class I glutamine amidotransferase-like protein [Tricladium varicosporioides]|nr:class I glutamine amidotransferase-like protein [Hymenoscyphus varicosporioides]